MQHNNFTVTTVMCLFLLTMIQQPVSDCLSVISAAAEGEVIKPCALKCPSEDGDAGF